MSDIKEIEAYAYQHNVPIMMDDGLEFLLGQMKENHCRSFLEIGTAVGRTSLVVHDTFEGIRNDCPSKTELCWERKHYVN